MSKIDNKENRAEKLVEISFYRKNSVAYTLVLLAIAAEFIYVVTTLSEMDVSYKMGVVTMANIGILFLLFTTAIKLNVYSKKFTMIGFYLAGYLVLRVFLLLPFFIMPTGELLTIYASSGATILFLVLGCLNSYKSIAKRERFKEKGAI